MQQLSEALTTPEFEQFNSIAIRDVGCVPNTQEVLCFRNEWGDTKIPY